MTIEQTVSDRSPVEHREESDSTGEIVAQPTAHEVKQTKATLPPLKHGDRLTRDEFHRRYEAMPHIKKAELIEGIVYMGSPVRTDIHGEPHTDVTGWLVAYRVATPGVRSSDNGTVRLEPNNEVQPDVLLRIEPEHGGNSVLTDKGYIEGAPELVVEIAGTSVDYDLHEKLEAYRRNDVQKYIVWQTQDKRLDWFRLVEGEYVPLRPNAEGIIESQVFPGLRLAVEALLAGDLATVLAELQSGLGAPEHTAFVERLSKR